MKINLQTASKEKPIPSRASFKRWVKAALENQNENAEITIRIVDETEMQELNKKYRHKDKPTNILSFPAEIPPEIDIPFLGDIVICAPIVNKEAKAQNKAIEAHWAHITIHGILHILGYDHNNPKNTKQMEAKEIETLNNLDFPNPYL